MVRLEKVITGIVWPRPTRSRPLAPAHGVAKVLCGGALTVARGQVCLQIARYGTQKRPAASYLPEAAVEELRELVWLRRRSMQEVVARINQLHRPVDLGFLEFTRYLKDLNTGLATAILHRYPTAQAFRGLSRKRFAKLSYDGRYQVGAKLAKQLIDAATICVGSQHSPSHQIAARYACGDPRPYVRGLSG